MMGAALDRCLPGCCFMLANEIYVKNKLKQRFIITHILDDVLHSIVKG